MLINYHLAVESILIEKSFCRQVLYWKLKDLFNYGREYLEPKTFMASPQQIRNGNIIYGSTTKKLISLQDKKFEFSHQDHFQIFYIRTK